MLKKILSAMVIVVSGVLLCNVKSGMAEEEDIKRLEERIDGIESTLGTACLAVEDLKTALEGWKNVYVTDICTGKVRFGGRVDSTVQLLTGTTRDELGVTGRVWFDARAKVVPEKLDFIIEFNSAGGNSVSAGLPSNAVFIDRSAFNDVGRGNVNLSKAYAKWKPVEGMQIDIGIMDFFVHEDPPYDVGFDNSNLTIAEGWGFESLNIFDNLGLVSKLPADAVEIPALALRYDFSETWTVRTNIQTTQTSSMFTTRNDFDVTDLTAWNSEIAFRPKILGQSGAYKFFYGLTRSGDSAPADTATGATLDPSGTNSCVGALFDQWLGKHFIINARYSVSEDDDIFKSSRMGVRSHWSASAGWVSDGDTFSAREFVGVGFGSARWGSSYERRFGTNDREQTFETFWRHRLADTLWVSPHLIVVNSPLTDHDATEIIPGFHMMMTF